MTELGRKVGSFETAEAATAASAQLIALGYDEREVGIKARGFHAIERPRARHCALAAAAHGLRFGAVFGVVVAAAAALGLDGVVAVTAAALASAAVGAMLGSVGGLIGHRRSQPQGWRRPPDQFEPERFDVVVSAKSREATHQLARWWEPGARPVRRAS